MRGKGFDFSLMVADAFVRGIRDIGYKSTATALDELIDNSIQAGATNIHVVFGFEGKSTKPIRVAIIDDGHGMDADMTRCRSFGVVPIATTIGVVLVVMAMACQALPLARVAVLRFIRQ